MNPAIERVSWLDGKRRKSAFLENVQVNGDVLTGTEVDGDGVLKSPSKAYLRKHGADHGTIRRVLVGTAEDLDLKREPMVVDHFYGTLVPKGTASQEQTS